ncbi:hypothetical protein FIV42_09370 [Persicimonas caeni]|uniref:Uncharacterized protein n=1 Tax=Persicimonas caeni TaxID=2292766 RepID=A0A4Y6PT37_PERCE|nr:hypothetical protein [Persicimonas caeni]QDG50935.1 hypothetical protein FIV42_09370 [Persicimonas caeni]QED32156.1 hypothetical protein FRD00_09365 [Persicimonas caeni]
MAKLHFPDIAASDISGSPRDWLPAPDAIVDACDDLAAAGEPDGLVDLLEGMGAPVLDMVVTPLSARASLLAAQGGRAFFHHELRKRVPMPEDQHPELAVWEAGTVPTWQDGVLEEPKYFSFFQDAPFPAFNPNHRRKWRAHELLHGALKFFWHPEMTRFEMYVGARMNELLPVVHWYAFDEIFRPRCDEHQGEVLYREYCGACEDAARPYWKQPQSWRDERRDQAVRWADKGLDHFAEEWQACLAEIDTGEVHAVERARLDASSDAIGYMRSHWNRMTAWSFGVWAETFLKDGVDYFSSLERYANNLAKTTQRLLSGDLDVDPDQFEVDRGRRAVQDVAYRLYLALGWLEDGTQTLREAEERLMPTLEQAAHHVHHVDEQAQLSDFSGDVVLDLLLEFDRVRHLFPDEVAEAVPSLGYTWCEPERFVQAGHGLLEEGVSQAVPMAADQLDEDLSERVEAFALSDEFASHGRLAHRFADWLATTEVPGRVAELARFEAWAMAPPKKDRDAELFACLPGSLDEYALRPGRTRLNATLSREVFSPMVVAQVTNDPGLAQADAEEIEMARIFMRGELRLAVVGRGAARIFDAIEEGELRREWVIDVDPESLASLLENGFVIWLPQPA